MLPTPEQERWGVATATLKEQGDDAQEYCIGQMRHFAELGDDSGIRFWADISRRIFELTKPGNRQ